MEEFLLRLSIFIWGGLCVLITYIACHVIAPEDKALWQRIAKTLLLTLVFVAIALIFRIIGWIGWFLLLPFGA